MKKNFMMIPNDITNILFFLDLTQREWKVIWLIIRLSYGCQKESARIKLSDFKTIGILPSHIKQVIKSLTDKKIILWREDIKDFSLNEKYLIEEFTNSVNNQLQTLSFLIGANLKGKRYQTGNRKFTDSVTSVIPNKEIDTYQKSNTAESGLDLGKDILKNRVINSDKYKERLANKSFTKVDPETFKPGDPYASAALDTWKKLEPDNPDAFYPTYLCAFKKGLPVTLFYQYASEIHQDPSIRNKGAVFNAKVKEYLAKDHDVDFSMFSIEQLAQLNI